MQRTIDPAYATTIIADSHGICDGTQQPTPPRGWRIVPPAEAAAKLHTLEDDFEHTAENPEPEVPWMKWKRGVKLKVTRHIPVETFLRTQATLKPGTIVTVTEATKSHVSISTPDGWAYHVDGGNCCYLEWWADPQTETTKPEAPWAAWARGTKLRATRTIPVTTSLGSKALLGEDTIVVVQEATKSHVSILASDDYAYRIDGSNCCYLEVEISWMEWKIGSKLRTTRHVLTVSNGGFAAIDVGVYLWVKRVSPAFVVAMDNNQDEHMIEGRDCCYLEVVQEPTS